MSEDIGRIHRHNYESHFSIMPHHIVDHDNLTWTTKSILWYLLSRPLDWKVYRAQIAKVYKGTKRGNGKDAIDSAFEELIEKRFIIYTPKDKNTGRFIHRYDVYPEPQPEPQPEKEQIKEKIPKVVKPATVEDRNGLNTPQPSNNSLPSNEDNNETVVVPLCLKNLGISPSLQIKLTKLYISDPKRIKDACESIVQMRPRNLEAALQTALKEGWTPKVLKKDIFEDNKAWGIRNFTKFDLSQVGVMSCVILGKGIEFSQNATSRVEFFEYENPTFKQQITKFMNRILKTC